MKEHRSSSIEFTQRWDRFREKKQKFIIYFVNLKKKRQMLSRLIVLITAINILKCQRVNFQKRIRQLTVQKTISFLACYIAVKFK